MKYFKKIRLLVIMLAGVVVLTACMHDGDSAQTEGNIYFSLANDGAAVNDINELNVTVGSLEVYNQADDNWVNVAIGTDMFNLLDLESNDRTQLIAAADLEAGTYQRVRMDIGAVEVVNTNDETEDIALAADTIEFDLTFQVSEEEDQAVHITFNVLADESLFTTEDGDYVFVAVIEADAQTGADVQVDDDRNVTISGGTQADSVQVGVDLEGNSRANYKLDPNTRLEVDLFGNVTQVEEDEANGDLDDEDNGDATSTDDNATSTDDNATSTEENNNILDL